MQVSIEEVGALQGAADTVRTVASMISYPLMSRIFAYFISSGSVDGRDGGGRSFPQGVLYAASVFSFAAALLFQFIALSPLSPSSPTRHGGETNKTPPIKS